MQIDINRVIARLLTLLALGIVVVVALQCVAPDRPTVGTSEVISGSEISTNQEASMDGWKKLQVKDRIVMMLPPDMKQTTPLGDSYSYREAYSNGQINLTIVYGEAIVPLRDDQMHFLLPSCETPRRPDNATDQESFIEIDGRKAKLSIDLSRKEEFISAGVCFAKTADNEASLRVVAYCKDDRALKIAQQIFSSIKFKD